MSSGMGRGLGSLIPGADRRRPRASNALERSASPPTSQVLHVPTAQVVSNPHQPRRGIDHAGLEDLVNSIREHGILQPLVMIKSGDGYQLIAGERRLRAAQLLRLKTVPAVVRDATVQQQLELAIVENVQRKDLNPMERAHAYHKLVEEFGLTQEQVARRVGKSRATVANTLRLIELPAEVQQALAAEKITEGHAKAIASAPTPEEQLRLLRSILSGSLSVRGGESLAKASGSRRRTKRPANPEYVAAEEELRDRFNTRVRIDKRGKVGTITVEFYSDEEYRTLLRRLRRT